MRILVTGGAGYVGRTLVERLSRDPAAELHVLDNLAGGEHRIRAVDLAAAVRLEIEQYPGCIRNNDRPLLCASTQTLHALTGWLPGTGVADSLRAAWSSREADGFI